MEKCSLSCMEEPKSASKLSRKGNRRLELCNAVNKSPGRRVRRSERLKKRAQMQKMLKDEYTSSEEEEEEEEEEEDDDNVEVEAKIGALKQIVPGGEELGVDMLFEKTAGYILALQLQLKALNYLTSFVQASDMEKMKLAPLPNSP